jgi:hypothetical protein
VPPEWCEDADVLGDRRRLDYPCGRLMTPSSLHRGRFCAPLLCTTAVACLIGLPGGDVSADEGPQATLASALEAVSSPPSPRSAGKIPVMEPGALDGRRAKLPRSGDMFTVLPSWPRLPV